MSQSSASTSSSAVATGLRKTIKKKLTAAKNDKKATKTSKSAVSKSTPPAQKAPKTAISDKDTCVRTHTTASSQVSEETCRIVPNTEQSPQPASDVSALESSSVPDLSPALAAAVDKIGNWKQCGISPPKDIAADSEFSDSNISIMSIPTPQMERSMLATGSKRTGVEMDMATKVANEMFQKGKDAIESSCNLRSDIKRVSIESMQMLYEVVLSLSDSRQRHIANLERERARHANELMSAERAHRKEILLLTKQLVNEVALARSDISATLAETKAIRDWQGYETREPYQNIKEISQSLSDLKNQIKTFGENSYSSRTEVNLEPVRMDYSNLKVGIDALLDQLNALRRDLHREQEKFSEVARTSNESLRVTVETLTHLKEMPLPHEHSDTLKSMHNMLTKLSNTEPTCPPPTTPMVINIEEHVQPIAERLEAVSSELRTMRLEKQNLSPPALSIGSELAQAEESNNKKTYAKSTVVKSPALKPNHTLIVSASNTNTTAEKVIDRIRVALDTKKTGAKIDRVRKARNRKVILSCGTKEDLSLVQSCVQQDKALKVEIAKAGNPLIIIRDVLSYHSDSEIVENLLAQNKQSLQNIDLKESTIRVRYRKIARNPHECHPVLEVSPSIHKNLIEVGKVYIGLQRRPVTDHSPLVQCTKCLGFGHTKAVCRERDELCSHCGNTHSWTQCKARKEGLPPKCKNCSTVNANNSITSLAHNAFSSDCPEKVKWDSIARSRISYC